jgi:hypothetical protein
MNINNKNKSVCILTQNHISKNPRVLKEVKLLHKLGFKVTVLTTWYSNEILKNDQVLLKGLDLTYQSYADLRSEAPGNFHLRLNHTLFRFINRWFKIETLNSGGYGANKLCKIALQVNADVYILHQEVPTLIGEKLIINGKKVAYDFEDWYSEDLSYKARSYRPIKLLKRAEQIGINYGLWCSTTSYSMSSELCKYYNCVTPPIVIYNSFSIEERNYISIKKISELKNDCIRLAWISQTIGPNRGLEEIIELLQKTNYKIEIHLAGKHRKEYLDYLRIKINQNLNIHIITHDYMESHKILNWIHQFDAGIAFDKAISKSRDLTITNKILYYLLAGIPVFASDTSGHREIASECPNSVFIIRNENDFNEIMNSCFNTIQNRENLYKKSWENGRKYVWELEEIKLKEIILKHI